MNLILSCTTELEKKRRVISFKRKLVNLGFLSHYCSMNKI